MNKDVHCTVRDLIQREYRKHKLRSALLVHAELDRPIEAAILNIDAYLREVSMLPDVGPKAVRVISDLLDRAAKPSKGT